MTSTTMDAVEQLARGARLIGALVEGVGQERARYRPEEGKWAIVEVIHHLADEEVLDFRVRLRAVLADPEAAWAPIDPVAWCRDRRYIEGDAEEALARFLTERRASIAWLAALTALDLERTHHHPKLGALRAGDLLAAWIDHDLLHARQLLGLHHAWHARASAPYSTAYAGPW